MENEQTKTPPTVSVVVSIGLAILTAGVLGWFSTQNSTSEDVSSIKPQVSQLQLDVVRIDNVNERQDLWQDENIRQNAQIEFLTGQMADLDAELRRLEARIRDLERVRPG